MNKKNEQVISRIQKGFLISMQMAIKNCELVFKKLPLTFVQGQRLKNSPYAPIFY